MSSCWGVSSAKLRALRYSDSTISAADRCRFALTTSSARSNPERNALRRFRVLDTIRREEDDLAGLECPRRGAGHGPRQNTQRHAGRIQRLHLFARPDHVAPVPGAGVYEAAAPRIQFGQKQRDESCLLVVCEQEIIQARRQLADAEAEQKQGLKVSPRLGHHERWTKPMAADVREHQPDLSPGHLEVIVVVPPVSSAGNEAPPRSKPGTTGDVFGK